MPFEIPFYTVIYTLIYTTFVLDSDISIRKFIINAYSKFLGHYVD